MWGRSYQRRSTKAGAKQ
uniref:Uncharacterized protein n=1 Tax=Arundo donax TaxID=35708 RepID=A0A0A8Z291_ARUDO